MELSYHMEDMCCFRGVKNIWVMLDGAIKYTIDVRCLKIHRYMAQFPCIKKPLSHYICCSGGGQMQPLFYSPIAKQYDNESESKCNLLVRNLCGRHGASQNVLQCCSRRIFRKYDPARGLRRFQNVC